eukprot:c31478_g1_i1 orf=2-181(-)
MGFNSVSSIAESPLHPSQFEDWRVVMIIFYAIVDANRACSFCVISLFSKLITQCLMHTRM